MHNKIDGSVGIPKQDRDYWDLIVKKAIELHFDGCSCVTQMYQECCFAHDLGYAWHTDLYGNSVTKEQVDLQFRKDIQIRSFLGYLSPMSWTRWIGVKFFGSKPWKKSYEKHLKEYPE